MVVFMVIMFVVVRIVILQAVWLLTVHIMLLGFRRFMEEGRVVMRKPFYRL